MDAVFFRDRAAQYDMKFVKRELIKAYASFRPRKSQVGAETLLGIVTGNWGCGAFNGDKQLKGRNSLCGIKFFILIYFLLAIIQLMAASVAGRPLIYAAYGDKNFVNSFADVYEFLKARRTTVGDLYRYLEGYSTQHTRELLFNYILTNPLPSHKS
jgi:poly(ADP-ribose) glycohydrolase